MPWIYWGFSDDHLFQELIVQCDVEQIVTTYFSWNSSKEDNDPITTPTW